MTEYDSPYARLVSGYLPTYQPSQLSSVSVLHMAANACGPLNLAMQNIIHYEDDIIMGLRAAPQLSQLAGNGDRRAVEVVSMLSSKQACRQGLTNCPELVPGIMNCLPSKEAVQAIASLSRDATFATMFFEQGAGNQMVSYFSSPNVLKDAVVALRNMLANQSTEALRSITLPAETVPKLCQLVNASGTSYEIIAPACDCLRLIGNLNPTGNSSFRSMLSLSSPDGTLAPKLVTLLFEATSRQTGSVQRKICVAIARLFAAISGDEECRMVLVELGAIQGLFAALSFIREMATTTDFQQSATNSILLSMRNITENIPLSSISTAHSLQNVPYGIDQVVMGLVDVFVTCIDKLTPTTISYAAGALSNLVANSTELREVAVMRGAVDWLVRVRFKFSKIIFPL